ncbi:MAG: nucleoside recognition domain-containing protein [Elusimicrobiota bacterium]
MNEIILNALRDLLNFVPKTLFIMFISLTAIWILIQKGIIDRISFIGKPLAKIIGLPEDIGIVFITSFGSVLSGNVLLSDFNKRGILTDHQTYLGSLFNSIPVYIKESFTYQIPVIISVLGLKVGLVCFTCFVFSGFAKLLFISIMARKRQNKVISINNNIGLQRQNKEGAMPANCFVPSAQTGKNKTFSFTQQLKIFVKMGGIYVGVTFIIFCLINSGFINYIERLVNPLTDILRLLPAVAIPVGTYIFSPLVGASTVGAMLQNGKILEIDAMIVTLLGGFLMLPVFMIRGSLAKYTSVFGIPLGLKIIFTSTIIGMGTRLIFLLVILIIRGA